MIKVEKAGPIDQEFIVQSQIDLAKETESLYPNRLSRTESF